MGIVHVCQSQPLEVFARAVFDALGAPTDISLESGRHLVRANLSGHDSHGVIRLMQYVTQADQGDLVATARPVIKQETTVTALVDARRSVGLYSTMFALDWVMERARQHGIAAATLRHSAHIGRLGEYTERAAERGLVAIVTVGVAGPGVGGMVPYGGRKRFFGANPWSMGIPTTGGRPVVFDGSSSTVAEGKVRVAKSAGARVPTGWIIDVEGNPTTDPEKFYAGGALVPLGGAVAGHKGYGLALVAALIGGLGMIDDPEPSLIGARIREEVDDPRGRIAGVFMAAVDPGAFGNADHFQVMVAETIAAAKRVPLAQGFREILVPGEPERRMREQRSQEGIPLPEAIWEDLLRMAERFSLAIPESKTVESQLY